MAYKDLHYSLSKFKSDMRSRIARKNPLQSADTMPLAMWIFEERLALKTMKLSAERRPQTIQAFDDWIAQHPELEDIGSGLVQLLNKEAEIETDALGKHQQAAQVIGTIYERDRAEAADIRDKKAAVESRLAHYLKHQSLGHPSSKIKTKLEAQLADLSAKEREQQKDMGDYTRLALREAFYMKLNAMDAYAHKASMLARAGCELVKRSDDGGLQQQDMLLMDCMLAIDGWEADQRPTVLDTILHLDGEEDVDAALLTDLEVASGGGASRNEKWQYVAELQPAVPPPEYREKDASGNGA